MVSKEKTGRLKVNMAPAPGSEESRSIVLVPPNDNAIRLGGGGAVVGGGSVRVRVSGVGVSRSHLRLELGRDGWTVTDLDSTNGTWLQGRRVTGTVPLPIPAVLRLGRVPLAVLQAFPEMGALGFRLGGFLAAGEEMARLCRRVLLASASELPLLLLGESGTGKDLLARAVHETGPWRDGPWVPVNAASLRPELCGAELFGHRRGAFTGAVNDRQGLVEAASGGTLFLDEAGELLPEVQAGLLRLLESGEVRPVGGQSVRRVSFRLIAATNADLSRRLASGRLRRDLLFRLNVLSLPVPSLREREDGHLLLRALASRTRGLVLTEAGLRRLEACAWPGNAREMKSLLRRLAVFHPEGVDVESVEAALARRPGPGEWAGASEGLSKKEMLKRLGIPRSTYYYQKKQAGRRLSAADGG